MPELALEDLTELEEREGPMHSITPRVSGKIAVIDTTLSMEAPYMLPVTDCPADCSALSFVEAMQETKMNQLDLLC